MDTVEILTNGKYALLEHGWCQFALQRPDDGRLCAVGALMFGEHGRVYKDDGTMVELPPAASAVLAEAAGCGYLVDVVPWNNDPDRTFDEVIDTFERAIKIAEERAVA